VLDAVKDAVRRFAVAANAAIPDSICARRFLADRSGRRNSYTVIEQRNSASDQRVLGDPGPLERRQFSLGHFVVKLRENREVLVHLLG
jgi:hypothetical protein